MNRAHPHPMPSQFVVSQIARHGVSHHIVSRPGENSTNGSPPYYARSVEGPRAVAPFVRLRALAICDISYTNIISICWRHHLTGLLYVLRAAGFDVVFFSACFRLYLPRNEQKGHGPTNRNGPLAAGAAASPAPPAQTRTPARAHAVRGTSPRLRAHPGHDNRRAVSALSSDSTSTTPR